MNKTAMIVLAQGFEEIEAITPIDLLRRAGITVEVTGLNSLEITGSHAITIKAEKIFSHHSNLPDALILPGGPGHKHLLASEPLIQFVNTMFQNQKLCAAICAAPSIFGTAGILTGKKATCFPGYEKKLGNAEFIAEPVVTDQNVITSRGAGTSIPFSHAIITYLRGPESADKVLADIVYNR